MENEGRAKEEGRKGRGRREGIEGRRKFVVIITILPTNYEARATTSTTTYRNRQ